MLNRLILAIAIAAMGNLALQGVPYYPAWWVAGFTLILTILTYWRFGLGLMTLTSVFTLAVAYHSIPLAVLFLILAAGFRLASGKAGFHPEFYILVIAAPLLALLPRFGLPPLEVLPVFLAPLLLKDRRVPAAATLACLWCLAVAIILQHSLFGHMILGPRNYSFFRLHPPPAEFYDFAWMMTRPKSGLLPQCVTVLWHALIYIFAHPILLLPVFVWGPVSQLLALTSDWRVEKNRLWIAIAGAAGAVLLMLAVPAIQMLAYGRSLPFPWVSYLILLVILGAGFLGYGEWTVHAESKTLFAKIRPSQDFAEKLLAREQERRASLSLEESLELQKELKKYIEKKFVRDVTALDLDVAGSAQLKLHEKPENVTRAFSEFWKYVDLIMLSKGARLLNRAGDGAIYIFGDPNKAVVAAKELLRNLDEEFNEKKNTLKNPFRIRQGLNSGTLIEDPTQQGGDVFSEVLDLAGHLQKAAAPGEVLISEKTFQKLVYKEDFKSRGTLEKNQAAAYGFRPGV